MLRRYENNHSIVRPPSQYRPNAPNKIHEICSLYTWSFLVSVVYVIQSNEQKAVVCEGKSGRLDWSLHEL